MVELHVNTSSVGRGLCSSQRAAFISSAELVCLCPHTASDARSHAEAGVRPSGVDRGAGTILSSKSLHT